MKTKFHPALFLAGVLFFCGCAPKDVNDITSDDKCGDVTNWEIKHVAIVNYGLEGSIREMYFENLDEHPDDICSEEHPTVQFYFYSLKEIPGASFVAKCYWSIYKQETLMTYDDVSKAYYCEMKPGLKDAFPGGKGYLYAQVVARFPTTGGQEQDSTYLATATEHGDLRNNVMIHFNYKVAK